MTHLPPRWHALSAFVDRWYAHPLTLQPDAEGEVNAAEARLGVRLPLALREWFVLTGPRLHSIQDHPRRLHELALTDGRLAVWDENQGVWTISLAGTSSEADPLASTAEPSALRGPLSEVLLGMVYSDTIVGAWAGGGLGPLGELRADVVGGTCDAASAAVDARVRTLPTLHVTRNPFFAEPWRGDAELLVRGNEGMWEWMAASAEAFERATALFELGATTERILVAVFAAPSPEVTSWLEQLISRAVDPLRGAGAMRKAKFKRGGAEVTVEWSTEVPEQCVALLEAAQPGSLVRAGYRSPDVMRWTACWPPGATRFSPK